MLFPSGLPYTGENHNLFMRALSHLHFQVILIFLFLFGNSLTQLTRWRSLFPPFFFLLLVCNHEQQIHTSMKQGMIKNNHRTSSDSDLHPHDFLLTTSGLLCPRQAHMMRLPCLGQPLSTEQVGTFDPHTHDYRAGTQSRRHITNVHDIRSYLRQKHRPSYKFFF